MELLMDSPPQYPNPNSTPKVLHPLMLNAMSTAKGAGLACLVKDGSLKECFSLGSEYNNKGSWKLQCLYCQKRNFNWRRTNTKRFNAPSTTTSGFIGLDCNKRNC